MSKKLEEFRFFPFVAWFLIIGFAAFTLSLTYRLSDATGISGEIQQYNITTQNYLKKGN